MSSLTDDETFAEPCRPLADFGSYQVETGTWQRVRYFATDGVVHDRDDCEPDTRAGTVARDWWPINSGWRPCERCAGPVSAPGGILARLALEVAAYAQEVATKTRPVQVVSLRRRATALAGDISGIATSTGAGPAQAWLDALQARVAQLSDSLERALGAVQADMEQWMAAVVVAENLPLEAFADELVSGLRCDRTGRPAQEDLDVIVALWRGTHRRKRSRTPKVGLADAVARLARPGGPGPERLEVMLTEAVGACDRAAEAAVACADGPGAYLGMVWSCSEDPMVALNLHLHQLAGPPWEPSSRRPVLVAGGSLLAAWLSGRLLGHAEVIERPVGMTAAVAEIDAGLADTASSVYSNLAAVIEAAQAIAT